MDNKTCNNLTWLALISLVLIFSGTACSKRYSNLPAFSSLPIKDSVNNSVGRFKTSYLADQIHAYFRGNINGPIAITTFVDVDDLYKTSSFGRMLSEQLLSELAMKGYNVIEIRHSEVVQVNFSSGEFGLSREPRAIRNNLDVSAVVVGTYSASPQRVYLNARIIDPATSLILSAGSVEMPLTEEISRMLRTNGTPTSLERIPVRGLSYNPAPPGQYVAPPNYAYAPSNFQYGYGGPPAWGPAKDELQFVEPEEQQSEPEKAPEPRLDLGS